MIAGSTVPVNQLSICDQTADKAAWHRALDRARAQGVRVFHQGETWYTNSISHPGQTHTVNGKCDCEASLQGLVCKHLAAVRAAQYAAGVVKRCDYCGRLDYTEHLVSELEWLGGVGNVERWYCGEGHGHQSAWSTATAS